MTEYELVDAIASLGSNLAQGQAATITILTAYLVVAHSAGADLIKFQVAFIGFVLVILCLLGLRMVLFGGALNFMWRVRLPKIG
jgi:hypothetical protein